MARKLRSPMRLNSSIAKYLFFYCFFSERMLLISDSFDILLGIH